MKRLLSAVLTLALLGTTAAVADPYSHGGQGYNGGYQSHNNYIVASVTTIAVL